MTLKDEFGADLRIVGWAHSRFGKQHHTLEDLIVEVTNDALRHAGIEAGDVDDVVLGNFNAGMNALAFPSSLVLQADPGLHGRGVTRVENACASGSAAVQTGIRSLLAGTAGTVLVVGAEKMTERDASIVGTALLGADYDEAGSSATTGFARLFADVAACYDERHRSPYDAMGAIAAKSHRQGAKNPFAHLRKELSVDFCRQVSEANPNVAGGLRRTDCSPVSDGAAALVISVPDRASGDARTPGVRIDGMGHSNDYLPAARRDPLAFVGTAAAWHAAMGMAGVGLDDLSFIELHDCFTIAELVLYEVLGLAPRGMGHRLLDEGSVMPGGRLPVNVSGGLKSKGHPVGATGVSQHVMAAMQLVGEAPGALQLPSPTRAAVHNMGGLAVANYVSVLSAL